MHMDSAALAMPETLHPAARWQQTQILSWPPETRWLAVSVPVLHPRAMAMTFWVMHRGGRDPGTSKDCLWPHSQSSHQALYDHFAKYSWHSSNTPTATR